MEPLSTLPPVWVAGGRQLVHASSPEKSEMHPNVLKRIVESDGWIARPTCPADLIALDLEEIVEARKDRGKAERPVHHGARELRLHRRKTAAPTRWRKQQQERYFRLTGTAGRGTTSRRSTSTGRSSTSRQMVEDRRKVGIEYMMLHTLTADLSQLDLIAKYIVEPFRTPDAEVGLVAHVLAGSTLGGRPQRRATEGPPYERITPVTPKLA